MGLDMYLYKSNYVKNWDCNGPEQRWNVSITRGGKPVTTIKPERISYIIEQVAYWQKAYSIHKWFVDYAQGGVDECQEAYVCKEQLKELVDLCKEVLDACETVDVKLHASTTYSKGTETKNYVDGLVLTETAAAIARRNLPAASGFFFGSTGYNEWYLDDLKDTIRQIEPLLSEAGGDFYYQASW